MMPSRMSAPDSQGPVAASRVRTLRLLRIALYTLADQVFACHLEIAQVAENAEGDKVLVQLLPKVRIVQVIHVRGQSSVHEALAAAPYVDELLLDSGNPSLAVKQLGGTGRVHDWTLSRSIVEQAGVPVWLAGGLRPDNVRAAIEAVQPHGVDVCSGLRLHGVLHASLLHAFARAVVG